MDNPQIKKPLTITLDSGVNEKALKPYAKRGLIRYTFANVEKGLEKKNLRYPNEVAFFTLDVSHLDSGDILTSPEVANISQQIDKIVGKNNWKDRRQLEAHYYSGNDIFVSEDKDDILSHQKELRNIGIHVMSIDSLINLLSASNNND